MSDEPELKKEEAEKNEFSWPWGKDKDKDKVGASNMWLIKAFPSEENFGTESFAV